MSNFSTFLQEYWWSTMLWALLWLLLFGLAFTVYWSFKTYKSLKGRFLSPMISVLAILYLVSPIDLIPDFIAFVGWLDDLFVAAAAFFYVRDSFKGMLRQLAGKEMWFLFLKAYTISVFFTFLIRYLIYLGG